MKLNNHTTWFDSKNLLPGDKLTFEIEKGILDAKSVVCFITNDYIKSKNCRLEFFFANNQNKKCLYVLLEKINIKEANGINIYLNGEAIRLDAYKLKEKYPKFNDFVCEVYRKIDESLNSKKSEFLEQLLEIKRDCYFCGREKLLENIEII